MSKIFKLKKWVTVPDAAKHLSTVLNEDVTEADILQFILNKHLKASVNLPNGCTVRHVDRFISVHDPEFPRKYAIYSYPDRISDYEIAEITSSAEYWVGIYDLATRGTGCISVLNAYNRQMGIKEVPVKARCGCFIEENGEIYCLIRGSFSGEDGFSHIWPTIPDDCLLGVRTEELIKFIQSLEIESETKELNVTNSRDDRMSLEIEMICAELEARNQPIKPANVWAELIKNIEYKESCCIREEPHSKSDGMVIVWSGIQGNLERLSHDALKKRLQRRKRTVKGQ